MTARATTDGKPRVSVRGLVLATTQLAKALAVLLLVLLLIASRGSLANEVAGRVLILGSGVGVAGICWKLRSPWIAVYVAGFSIFAVARGLADDAGMPVRFDYVIGVERGLFFGTVPTVWLQDELRSTAAYDWLAPAGVTVYLSYFAAPHLVILALARWRTALLPAFATAILLMLGAGLAFSAAIPTAPPSLAAREGLLPPVTPVIRATISGTHSGAYDQTDDLVSANQVAAMPSLHMAVTVLIALLAFRIRRSLGFAALGYALAMGFTLTFAGAHYVADLAAGSALAAACWWVGLRIVGNEAKGERG